MAALFMTLAAQAQDGLKLGLKAGGNYASVTGDVTDAKYKFGFHAGGFLDYGISDFVSIRPELLFSMKGYEAATPLGDAEVSLNYLDLPILARINADGLFFEGGPTLGYLLSSSMEIGGKSLDGDDDGMAKFELGYAAGLGYQLPTGLGIGLRYQGGITSIFDDSDGKARNSVFQLSLSYTLGGR